MDRMDDMIILRNGAMEKAEKLKEDKKGNTRNYK